MRTHLHYGSKFNQAQVLLQMSMDVCDRSTRLIEIAQQLGYGSEAAFSVAFKRATGITPAMCRTVQETQC